MCKTDTVARTGETTECTSDCCIGASSGVMNQLRLSALAVALGVWIRIYLACCSRSRGFCPAGACRKSQGETLLQSLRRGRWAKFHTFAPFSRGSSRSVDRLDYVVASSWSRRLHAAISALLRLSAWTEAQQSVADWLAADSFHGSVSINQNATKCPGTTDPKPSSSRRSREDSGDTTDTGGWRHAMFGRVPLVDVQPSWRTSPVRDHPESTGGRSCCLDAGKGDGRRHSWCRVRPADRLRLLRGPPPHNPRSISQPIHASPQQRKRVWA